MKYETIEQTLLVPTKGYNNKFNVYLYKYIYKVCMHRSTAHPVQRGIWSASRARAVVICHQAEPAISLENDDRLQSLHVLLLPVLRIGEYGERIVKKQKAKA